VTATKGAATDISQIQAARPDLVVGESMERDLRSTDEDASRHARPEPCPILDLHDRRGDRPVGFVNSGGLVFVDESAQQVAAV
jgi:hypothetical protein